MTRLSKGTTMPTTQAQDAATAPTGTPAKRPRIVVGVDCSPDSSRVLGKAAEVAKQLDADLEAVFVYMTAPEAGWVVPFLMPDEELEDLMHAALRDAVNDAFGPNHPPRLSLWAVGGDPAKMLLARARGASLLVVGTRSHSEFANVLLGSVATKCIEHATGPVLVVHTEKPDLVGSDEAATDQNDAASASASAGRIVVGVDGSTSSKEALRWAARFAAFDGVGIDALIAWDPPVYFSGVGLPYLPIAWDPHGDNLRYLEKCIDDVFGRERPTDLRLYAEEGAAGRRLLAHAKDAALLVVGSRGHGGFHNLLLGSVSSKCANHSTCPVLVVHAAPAAPDTVPAADADLSAERTNDPQVPIPSKI